MRRYLFAAHVLLPALFFAGQNAPEPVPGLRIPSGNRPYALDEFQGKKQLVPVHSSAVQANNHKGSNLTGGLLAGPFYKSKFTTELAGETAKTILHSTTPVFYLRFDNDPTQARPHSQGGRLCMLFRTRTSGCSRQ